MNLEPGTTLHGCTVLTAEKIAEVDGTVYTLRHELSGARILYIANQDVEKTFYIGFKTPPADETGTFHIIEHSVLCGSDKFPVKEPFVALLKSSMQTFLNAITFPDKTIYPISTTNDQDFENLMDVYMDAVLHPLLRHRPTTFEQEGWHYELAGPNADAPQGPYELVYNGIVYNEMKGALNDPESKMSNALDAALFPDTAYRFESGGTPEEIPTLTYEKLMDAHARHYRLDNSYIALYGKLDIDRVLGFLDETYLTPEARATAGDDPGAPNPLPLQGPVKSLGNKVCVVTDAKNAAAAVGYVAGTFRDRTRLEALSLLRDVLMGTNDSPLKRALLDAGLADEVFCRVDTGGVQQAVLSFKLRNMKPGAFERFQPLLEDEVRKVLESGIDRDRLAAALAADEFWMRESGYASCSGLGTARKALNSWLYDDECATDALRFEGMLEELHAALETDYFENLLREVVLENPHVASVELVPIADDEEETCEVDRLLQEKAAALDAASAGQIRARVAELRRAQEEPDAPEALATLPRLKVSDLGEDPGEPAYRLDEGGPIRVLRHGLNTPGIVYTERCYPLDGVSFEELPYAAILADVLGDLDTGRYSVTELETQVKGKLGMMRFSTNLYDSAEEFGKFKLTLNASTSSLAVNVRDAAELSREVMFTSKFDCDKLKTLLVQRLNMLERGFANNGRGAAKRRAASYYNPAAVVDDQMNGVEYYRFLKPLVARFDERYEELAAKLAELAQRVFVDDGCLLSFVGSDDDLAAFLDAGGALGTHAAGTACRLVVPEPVRKNEAFVVPSAVSYSVLSCDTRKLQGGYSGAQPVAGKALSFEYLWNEVRVKGGAYGSYFNSNPTGDFEVYSYRDPHLDRTLDIFEQSARWLRSFDPAPEDFEGYIISATADADAPMKPRQRRSRQLRDFMEDITPQMKAAWREQVVNCAQGQLHDVADQLEGMVEEHNICTFAGKELVEKSPRDFEVVKLLEE